ncbi:MULTISPECIES: carboxypeptidase-like regulatory domain-containing protein [Olivibacter]|uniref:Carboxypeptidase-like regulatory domain-containing protein n=1 Tax=Olivibacter jilunii TaxID=985016 RepID=A0ABW6AW25_9SPHI
MKKIKTRPLKKRSLIFADYRFRCLLAFLLYAATAYSQQTFTIQGTVKAIDTKESLPGVSIVANNKAIAISDANGNFAVKVNANTSIIFKYVGYRPYTLNVTSNLTKLSISLESANTLLEDVVVVGYGTQKKENVTGSVSTLDMKEKEGSPTTNISNALAGMPGMFVRLGQSQPGIDRSEIRIRGMGTLSNNNPSFWLMASNTRWTN